MNKLEYKDIYNKTAYQAFGLLKDQLLQKMKPIYDLGYWGSYGASYDYTPWGIPVYLALRDNWTWFENHKFFDTNNFGGETFTFKKYYWDQIFTSSAKTGSRSAVELIVEGIKSLMNCFRREDRSTSYQSSSIYDMVYIDSSTSDIWRTYTEAWNVGTITNSYISYNSYKLLGIHLQSADILFALSEIICSFKYYPVYIKDEDIFTYVETGD